jgi:metal-dependent amidase/aminoacylase/carboxypeptidase family protein
MDFEDEGFVIVRHSDMTATYAPEYLDDISSYVDEIATSLWPVNKKIHDNPELGFNERIAHKVLTQFMDAQPGWKVRRSVYGMDTAWIAVFESGQKGPVISFNVEMGRYPSRDALESPVQF